MNHRRVILSLFVLAAVISGTAGYSSMQAERSVDIAVANKGDAFLSVEGQSPNDIENGESETAFVVTNQLGQTVDLTVQGSNSDSYLELELVPAELGNGDTAAIKAHCTATTDGTRMLEITVRAESSDRDGDVVVQVERSTDIECIPQSTSTPP